MDNFDKSRWTAADHRWMKWRRVFIVASPVALIAFGMNQYRLFMEFLETGGGANGLVVNSTAMIIIVLLAIAGLLDGQEQRRSETEPPR